MAAEVEVEVLVNFDGLRRGWRGTTELSHRIELLASRGYLRILGHVDASPEPLPAPEPPAPTETPAKRARPSRAKRKASETPSEDDSGDRPGDVRVE